eukprot:Gregarina_sp_Poly_1__3528@NODE_202_length_11519_cov_188_798463_g180_i0_p1_GENE_NODE_202_length_11519_cov_188_798463_g180_i0NODE_202_length_11519_cov_188_798463_g180_i0_p1_ORF_typecomplete_len872_score127_84DSPc/PF00782_20/3e22Y_phosphatase2/PF03162_13/0_11_NODE_202_length_11519_cov_188_798463_g180_i070899704
MSQPTSAAPRGLAASRASEERAGDGDGSLPSAGSLLGRRQRVPLERKRPKRMKGSPPPPKLARKRMVVSGPPTLTEAEVETETQPPETETQPPASEALVGNTPVNAGAMTCSDLAYLLSMDGFVGAIRLRDGLFLGDQLAATDHDFFNANVVLYVINCCESEVPNHFDCLTINNQHIKYLSFSWKDLEGEKIFSPRGVTLRRVFDFIESADSVGASCLVHSKFGKSRSVCVVCGYLMMRYRWSAKKALEYLIARRPDLTLRRSFVRQILAIEHHISHEFECEMSTSWDEKIPSLSGEELLLRNTFKNSFAGSEGYSLVAVSDSQLSQLPRRRGCRISWKGVDDFCESTFEFPLTQPVPLPERSRFPSILKTRLLSSPTGEERSAMEASLVPTLDSEVPRAKHTSGGRLRQTSDPPKARMDPTSGISAVPPAGTVIPRSVMEPASTPGRIAAPEETPSLHSQERTSPPSSQTETPSLIPNNNGKQLSKSKKLRSRVNGLAVTASSSVSASSTSVSASSTSVSASSTSGSPSRILDKGAASKQTALKQAAVSIVGVSSPTLTTGNAKVLWGSPRTAALQATASRGTRPRVKSRSLSPSLIVCSKPNAQSPPSLFRHSPSPTPSQTQCPPSPQHCRGGLPSPSPLKPTVPCSLTRLLAKPSPSWERVSRTTISEIVPSQNSRETAPAPARQGDSLVASSLSSLPPHPKRNSLQSLRQPPREQILSHDDASIFPLPRGQQRVASNTLEYRQSRSLANEGSVRLRAISSSRSSLSRSELPSSSLMGLKRETGPPLGHHTLPPAPIAKVQVRRRFLPWDVEEAIDGRPFTSRISQIKAEGSHQAVTLPHVTYRDGIAVTQRCERERSWANYLFLRFR